MNHCEASIKGFLFWNNASLVIIVDDDDCELNVALTSELSFEGSVKVHFFEIPCFLRIFFFSSSGRPFWMTFFQRLVNSEWRDFSNKLSSYKRFYVVCRTSSLKVISSTMSSSSLASLFFKGLSWSWSFLLSSFGSVIPDLRVGDGSWWLLLDRKCWRFMLEI